VARRASKAAAGNLTVVRILICSLEAPLPPVNGFRLQLRALIEQLRQRHDIRILAFRYPDQTGPNDDPQTTLLPRPITSRAAKALALPRAFVTRSPLGVGELAARLRGPLRAQMDRFAPDVVHIAGQELSLLAKDLGGRPSLLTALDAEYLNVEAEIQVSSGLRRVLLGRQLAWVKRFEGSAFRRFDLVTLVSEADRDAVLELDPRIRIEVIPNGVDVDFFAPDASGDPDPQVPLRIVFTGVMRYPPNVAAAEFLTNEVFPRVLAVVPGARVAIVGRDPAPRVTRLGRTEGVEVVGEVPDLRPWLRGSRVYACPMVSGTGIKNKLLEAMACGVPCVATPLATRGTHAEPGRDLLIGSDAGELAASLVRVLREDGLARDLAVAGRAYVAGNHSWAAVARRYEQAYSELTGRGGPEQVVERVP
jgi:glycosyltransferase involved in cell wall biosynthesis